MSEKLLHQKNPNLHSSREVEDVANYLRRSGESIPNEPTEKIKAYLGFLATEVNDGLLTGDTESQHRQIDHAVIKAKDIPERVFELEQQIAREQGHGDIPITDEFRRQKIESIQADQRVSLEKWMHYLSDEQTNFPDWFRVYTYEAVLKLGDFDKEKKQFKKRSNKTVSPFADLNREALAYVYDKLHKQLAGEIDEDTLDNPKLKQLLEGANFGKLYAHAILEVTPATPEQLASTEGEWKKYEQTNDSEIARKLAESLQGHGTGWCTAGVSTAEMQLRGGDFYVYYTYDEEQEATIPRVAIRMENGQVAEVRGIKPDQSMEDSMVDIAIEQVQALPGGEAYFKKAEDMRRLTEIDSILRDNPDAELTKTQLSFLYELDGKIEGFGYGSDPRIVSIRSKRNFIDDIESIYENTSHQDIVIRLIESGYVRFVTYYLEKFKRVDKELVARAQIDDDPRIFLDRIDVFPEKDMEIYMTYMIERGHGRLVEYYFSRLDNQPAWLLKFLIDAGFTRSFEIKKIRKFKDIPAEYAYKLIDGGNANLVMYTLSSFTDLDSNEVVRRAVSQGIFTNVQPVYLMKDKLGRLDPEVSNMLDDYFKK